ncbi:hypothetical protein JTB14_029276 [Gonioctena quinquepunctata]|nr:hypothetical protein JTB14_029276 [Gonioctena quinquepunctata]
MRKTSIQSSDSDHDPLGQGMSDRKISSHSSKILKEPQEEIDNQKVLPFTDGPRKKKLRSEEETSIPIESATTNRGDMTIPGIEQNILIILGEILKKILHSPEQMASKITSPLEVPVSPDRIQEVPRKVNRKYSQDISQAAEKHAYGDHGLFHVCRRKKSFPPNFPTGLTCVYTNEKLSQFEISFDRKLKFVVPLHEVLAKMLAEMFKPSDIEISIKNKIIYPDHKNGFKIKEVVVRILNYKLIFETEIFRKVNLAYGNMNVTV